MKLRTKHLIIALLLAMGIASLALFLLENATRERTLQIPGASTHLPIPYPMRAGQPLPIPETAHPPDATATRDEASLAQARPTATYNPPSPTVMLDDWETLKALASSSKSESQTEVERRVEALYDHLYALKGTVIAQGGNTAPACFNGPRSYRIEEIVLPEQVTLKLGISGLRSDEFTIDKYWRVTVIGGPFPEDAQPEAIWIDNSTYGYKPRIKNNTEVSLIYFYTLGIYEGATIGIEYYGDKRAAVPEKIHFVDGRPEQAHIIPTARPTPNYEEAAASTATASMLTPAPAQMTKEEYLRDLLLDRKGKVIARNQYPPPVCSGKLGGYQIEEVTLPGATTFEGRNGPITADKLWRVSVDGSFYIGALYWTICVGDTPLLTYEGSPLKGITFDRSVLKEGANISASYGSVGCPSSYGGTLGALPEKLHFSSSNEPPQGIPTPDPTEEACKGEKNAYDFLYGQEGKVIAEGSNSMSTCFYKVKTYRVEEITLLAPKAFKLDGHEVVVDKYWRITVYGESFGLWQTDLTIWIDDTPLDVKRSSGKSDEITAITLDKSLLHQGATIKFSPDRLFQREELPEKLHLDTTR